MNTDGIEVELEKLRDQVDRIAACIDSIFDLTPEQRRERIATSVLSGLLSARAHQTELIEDIGANHYARHAVRFADALIEELDKQ